VARVVRALIAAVLGAAALPGGAIVINAVPASAVGSVGVSSMIQAGTCATGSTYCFAPSTVAIPVGAIVQWTNTTPVAHTASDDGATWTTGLVNPGQTTMVTFNTAGTFTYHCMIHPDMHGTILVGTGYAATASPQQYSLQGSDGSSWAQMDSSHLAISVTPAVGSTAIISGNADLWTAAAGYNQDLGIDVNGSTIAWKESGGFAGTFSPNAAFVQTMQSLSAGMTYAIDLRWKTNKPAAGATIFAGAGPIPPGSTSYSPTRLTVRWVPASATNPVGAARNLQYSLSNSDGATWMDLDPNTPTNNPTISFTAPSSGTAILSANADLWTATAGYNQDLGINVNGGIVGWKESGGFAGTFSPNAAFVQVAFPMVAGSYTIKLQWKTNKPAVGATIYAAAGAAFPYSDTSVSLRFVPSGIGITDAASTNQYSLTGTASDGVTWQTLDVARLAFTIPSVATNCVAIIGGNADLWTANAGYNQDLAITVDGTVASWKESGGFAGTFSPNAAFVQAFVPLSAGSPHDVSLQWKANKPAQSATIFAAAGPAGAHSETELTAEVISCS